MTQDELYTLERCKRVGEWVGEHTDIYDAIGSTPWEHYFQYSTEAPQLIREALAREGVFVDQCSRSNEITLRDNYHNMILKVEWEWYGRDPDARHALFEAVDEYVKSKKPAASEQACTTDDGLSA